jgi:uncharacterized protein YodC (DUF2158 family)
MAKFKGGDVVMLKSGGPPMTVQIMKEKGEGETMDQCQWFSGAELQQGVFVESSLTSAADEEPGYQ